MAYLIPLLTKYFRADLIKALPNVKTIDGEAVHAVNSPESEESDSDQECTETVQDTGTAVLLRSLSRLDEVVAEHNSRLNLIKQHDNLPDEKFSVGSNSLDQSGLNSVEKRINSILHVMVEVSLHHFCAVVYSIYSITVACVYLVQQNPCLFIHSLLCPLFLGAGSRGQQP